MYDDLIKNLVEQARTQDHIVGALLTGSLARGDALPGTDLDLVYILSDGVEKPFRREMLDGVLVEQSYLDEAAARAQLTKHPPMKVYGYLDGRILYDPDGVLSRLTDTARQRYETYRVPEEDRTRIASLLGFSDHKINVGIDGGDWLRAAFVVGTSSWQIIEGLWAANDRPLPPNSSVRPHLADLHGPDDIEQRFENLFTGDTHTRVHTALDLIRWIIARLSEAS